MSELIVFVIVAAAAAYSSWELLRPVDGMDD
jgi:hypothetical protein